MGGMNVVLTGVVVGFAIFLLQRLVTIPREIRHHDRTVRERDDDLRQWVADDDEALAIELHEIGEDCNSRNLFYSGYHVKARAFARSRKLQRFRDQAALAEREAARIRDSEGAGHKLVRLFLRKPFAVMAFRSDTKAIVGRWRTPEAYPEGWVFPGDGAVKDLNLA